MILYYLIFILMVSSICLVTLGLLQQEYQPRLRLTGRPAGNVARSRSPTLSPIRILRPLNFLTRPFSNLTYLKELQLQTEVLKINLDVSALILVKLFLAVLLGVLAFVLFKATYTLVGVLIGFFAPDFFLRMKIRAKKEAIVKFFPETIDLLDMCISSGSDFLFALKWVIDKCDFNPFIEQLGIALGEIQVGKSRSDALKDMAKRLKLPDISSFVRTIIQAERMGTSIEDAFKNLSEDTRNTRFQAGERYAIKASIKILFPLIFCILPAILIVVAGPILINFMEGGLFPKGAF